MGRRLAEDNIEGLSLRTMVWVDAVVRESGKPIAELEEEFRTPLSEKTNLPRSCIWQKYQRGEVVPRSSKPGTAGLIERVEARYPETATWFHMPLWRLCNGRWIGVDEIKSIYCGLEKELRDLFVRNEKATFWRNDWFDNRELCEELIAVPSIDGLIAQYGLLKEAENLQDPELYKTAAWAIVTRLKQAKTDRKVLNLKVRNILSRQAERWHKQAPAD